jgi:AcrR family transcriptional regulator
MKRTYTLKRRAEQQAETRRRIVEAAVDLHSTVGPAMTTFTMLAERAGVQRHTLYAHFPDEFSLNLACSSLAMEERDRLPNADPWRTIEHGPERLRAGLTAIYGWYERNAALAGCVLRDVEYHEVTQRIVQLRFGPSMASYREVLGSTLNGNQRAALLLALSFFTWRTLARDAGQTTVEAVETMVRAIDRADSANVSDNMGDVGAKRE